MESVYNALEIKLHFIFILICVQSRERHQTKQSEIVPIVNLEMSTGSTYFKHTHHNRNSGSVIDGCGFKHVIDNNVVNCVCLFIKALFWNV